MRRLSFILLLLLTCFAAQAQTQFGYVSYDQILKEMPEYAKATQDLATLKAKYEAEAQKGEEEFQRKFVDFLQGQKDFPQAIMQKRQAELQSLMDNGVNKVSGPLRGWFFTLAFIAIGLTTNFRELGKYFKGGKPIILYVCGQSFNILLTIAMAWLMFKVVFPEITASI